jgi:perosamine synthetase
MIPVNEIRISKEDIKEVVKTLKSGKISGNVRDIEKFELKVSHICHQLYGIATSNGTTALHLALMSSEIGSRDEIIIPSLTMAATAFAVIHSGAKPVLVDIDRESWCIDSNLIQESITSNTKAIIPVHLYGNPCNMDEIMRIAKDNNLIVIEDVAEAFGATFKNKPVGSFGDSSCLSFYATKMITTGEGGMIVTSNKEICNKARSIRNMNFGEDKRYLHKGLGYNYRMSNILASLGLSQVNKLNEIVTAKRHIHKLYEINLDSSIQLQKGYDGSVWWMNGILVDEKRRDSIRRVLLYKGIETGDIFESLSIQSFLDKRECKVSEDISKGGILLPSSIYLKEGDIEYICKTINKII